MVDPEEILTRLDVVPANCVLELDLEAEVEFVLVRVGENAFCCLHVSMGQQS